MEPEKNLNFLFRIFFYSFYCFLRVLFSRRAGNYVYAALAEVSRLNAEEKARIRLDKQHRKEVKRVEKENRKRAKQGKPELPFPPHPAANEATAAQPEATTPVPEPPPAPTLESAPTPPAPQVAIPVSPPVREKAEVDGVYLLSLFQKQGRLVDFLQQDITAFSNAEVGEAARVVHEGCSRTLRDYFTLAPIRNEDEGAEVKVESGYNLAEINLIGNVRGSSPYRGELLHHGWKVTDQHPPQQLDPNARHIVQPAEIEVR